MLFSDADILQHTHRDPFCMSNSCRQTDARLSGVAHPLAAYKKGPWSLDSAGSNETKLKVNEGKIDLNS